MCLNTLYFNNTNSTSSEFLCPSPYVYVSLYMDTAPYFDVILAVSISLTFKYISTLSIPWQIFSLNYQTTGGSRV